LRSSRPRRYHQEPSSRSTIRKNCATRPVSMRSARTATRSKVPKSGANDPPWLGRPPTPRPSRGLNPVSEGRVAT
jgi:hypothetical protein